jgi:spore maturation protein CgeB
MAAMGYCPSGRLFEAAACGTPVLSDWWEGLNEFFEPGQEILIGRSTAEALKSIEADSDSLKKVGLQARERALACHTAEIRARQLISLIESSARESAQIERPSFACKEA